MATLVSSVINRVVQNFQIHDSIDTLTGTITTTATSLVVGTNYRMGEGSRIEIGSELMYVSAFNTTTKTATVVRGFHGTTPAAHTSGAMVITNPRVPRFTIMDYINDCLEDMHSLGLFAVGISEQTYSGSTIGYSLPSDVEEVLAVQARWDSTAQHWDYAHDWEFMDNAETDQFANAKALMMLTALPASAPFRVIYATGFTQVTAESDDLEANAGLASYMARLVYGYCMAQVLALEEAERSQISQAQNHQRSQDVPPFLALRTSEWYKARYEEGVLKARARQTKTVRNTRTSAGYGS